MKNYILTIVFCSILFMVNAQTVNLKAGYSVSKMELYNSVGTTINYYGGKYTGLYATLGIDYLQKSHLF